MKITAKKGATIVSVFILVFLIIKFYDSGANSFLFSIFLYIIGIINIKKDYVKVTLICLLIVESMLSFFSPYKSYSERNGSIYSQAYQYKQDIVKVYESNSYEIKSNSEFTYTHKYNELGFRDENLKQNHFKYFIIGDSFIEGYGADSLNKLDYLIEKQISCNNCVLNLGRSGNDMLNSFSILKQIYGEGITADTVLLNLNSTDIMDIIGRSKKYGYNAIIHRSIIFQFCYGSSFIFRHLTHLFTKIESNFFTPEEFQYNEAICFNIIENKLLEYKNFCNKNNTVFILLIQPMKYEVANKKSDFISLEPFLKENNFIYFYFYNAFQKKAEELYWPIDRHFNALGYSEYSKLICDSIFNAKAPQ